MRRLCKQASNAKTRKMSKKDKLEIKVDRWFFSPLIMAGMVIGWGLGLLYAYLIEEGMPFWQHVLFLICFTVIGIWLFPMALSFLIYYVLKKKHL